MFINRKDLEKLENKLKEEFEGIIKELREEIETLKLNSPRQKTKKVVD